MAAIRGKRLELAALSIAGIVVFFGIWWLLATGNRVNALILPTPSSVIATFFDLTRHRFANFTIQEHLAWSLMRFILGFVLAAVVGVPLGLAMGWFRWLDYIVSPLFEAVRFVAPIAWVPFAALWFGTGIGGPILIIFAGAFPPCLINAYRGARHVDRHLIEAAQTLGADDRTIIFKVLLPAAMPSIVAGLRVSAGLGWQSLIGAELIVVSAGIGYLMVQGQSNLNTAIVMSGMIAIGLVGVAIDLALRTLERAVGGTRGLH
jgi:ABC-type nitrate/sulfonate/bicarbonate transport system permease component